MKACNLIPVSRQRRDRHDALRRRWGIIVGAYGLAVLGACVFLTTGNNPARAAASARTIQSLNGDEEQVRRDLGQLKTQLIAARRHLDRSNTIASHPDFSPLLGVLARERRGEVVLESCSLRPGALTASPNPIERRPTEYVLTISGLAREARGISAYTAALEATKAFDSVTIQEMRGRGDRTKEKSVGFSLRCVLKEGGNPGAKP